MPEKSENTCSTCHRPIGSRDLLGGICPPCLLAAGSTPGFVELGKIGTSGTRTTWDQAFPQFRARKTLREEKGFVAMAGRLVGDQVNEGAAHAVLQVWSGQALAAEGGSEALLARIGALRMAAVPGIAEIVDAGDLRDAVYLIAGVPEAQKNEPSLADCLPALGRLLASVRAACGNDLELAPAFVFSDPEGELCLVPRPIASTDGSEPFQGRFRPLEAGRLIGTYALVERIGEGGFGEVWKARLERPVTRTVAVKILKQGFVSPRMQARFEVEQQALARLDHPHVARFFEGGTTRDGRLYFAMEWVDGQSITDFCQANGLDLDQRLRLFRQVCQAVQHAHQKGIIHRDIKPSNVMVAAGDGDPSVKVIDFGIARALQDPLTDGTLLTRADEIVGTPVSMSPEQAAGSRGGALDARTDVYGLGVLLYELLAGVPPFDAALPAEELRRRIREEGPPKPSTRLQGRQATGRVRGDLDWIVMRCLEKEPDRRYESVSALVRDLQHHENNEPVEAGPPEITYRVRKYVRRYRVGLTVAGTILAALLVAGGATFFGMLTAREERAKALASRDRAEREAEIAQAVSQFLSEELLALEEPDGLLVADPRNQNITLRTVLERAAARIEGRFEGLPEVEGALRRAVAASFFAIGDLETAAAQAEQALALLEKAPGAQKEKIFDALRLSASIEASRGRLAAANELLERIASLAGDSSLAMPEPIVSLEADVIRGDLLLEQGQVLEAQKAYERALRSSESRPSVKVSALSGAAMALEQYSHRETALAKHREALASAKENLSEKDPLALETARRYARFLADLENDLESAEESEVVESIDLARAVQAAQGETLGLDHPATLRTRFDLAFAFGNLPPAAAGAFKELEAILAAAEVVFRADHPELLRHRLGVAIQHERLGNHQAALDCLKEIVQGGVRSVGEAHPIVVEATRRMGEASVNMGQTTEAMAHFQKAVERARRGLSPAALARQKAVQMLAGRLLASRDGLPEAIDLLVKELSECGRFLDLEHRLPAHYLDLMLMNFRHDRTGAAALAAAELALRRGGTPADTIQSLLQLALAAQMSLRPSFFVESPIPLPDAYFRLLEAQSMSTPTRPAMALPPVLVEPGAVWRASLSSEGEVAPPGWMEPAFDDSLWRSGAAPLGFGEPDIVTDLREGRGAGPAPVSICIRHRFVAPGLDRKRHLLLRLRCDDGALVYLNGKECLRFRLPEGPLGTETRSTFAVGGVDEAATQSFLLSAGDVIEGENVLAVRVFQHHVTSSDLFASVALYGEAPLPMERLADFDPDPAYERLNSWLPGLTEPLDEDWRKQMEAMTAACLGEWREALDLGTGLAPQSELAAARFLWFQRTALERLGRHEEAKDLFRLALPKRDPQALSRMIDLTDHYNAYVVEPWHVMANGMTHEPFLAAFPLGVGSFDGIDFDARGIIQLVTPNFASPPPVRDYPSQVKNIVIGQKISKLQLLNGSLLYDEPDRVIATVVVHFVDGSRAEFPIRYWRDTRTYMAGTEPSSDSVRSGWRGPDPFRPGNEKELYVASWTNPNPETAVAFIDLRAEPSDAALFVVGITVESVHSQ